MIFGPEILDFGRFEASFRGQTQADLAGSRYPFIFEDLNMAKAVTIKVKLVSTADTGFYYVAKKNCAP